MKNKLTEILYRIVPKRALLPVVSVFVMQFIAYYVPKLINRGRDFFDLTTPLDEALPFVPVFVVFYVLAYLQWIAYYVIIAREEKDLMYRFLLAGAISKLFCMVLFLAMPTSIVRPDASGGGFFRFCCRVIYHFDEPTNLFPSMHCLESWLCLRLALEQLRRGRVPEVSRSMLHGYSGEMIHCVNRMGFKRIEDFLTKETRSELETRFERILSRRKWRFDRQLEAAAEDAAEAAEDVGELYVKFHTFRTCLLSALVLLSTVFIKQHFVLDMVAAVAIAEFGLQLGRVFTHRLLKRGSAE